MVYHQPGLPGSCSVLPISCPITPILYIPRQIEPNSKISLEVTHKEDNTNLFSVRAFLFLLLILIRSLLAPRLFFLFVDYHKLS
jgi:hypothetical protein